MRGAGHKKNTAGTPEAGRVRRLRASLRESGAGAALITNAADIRYLTGFHGADSWLIVFPRRAVIVSDFRFEEELGAVEAAQRGVRVHIRRGDLVGAACGLVLDAECERLAFQPEHVSVALRGRLVKKLGAKRLKGEAGLVSGLREIKDAAEIEQIKKAVRLQEAALVEVLEGVRPGMTELEIAARLEHAMRVRGSSEPAFDVIVAARANGSLPHAIPGRTRTAKGKPLLIDWGATVGGYRSDMTRTFGLGGWPRELREVYEVVLEAQETALGAIASGVSCAEVDAAARDIIEDAGYGGRFGHGLGHGVGLDIHEAPRVARGVSGTLESGMVVTVEPGVYLPGIGGVRLEDLVVVTDRGHRNLSRLPKDLDWATR